MKPIEFPEQNTTLAKDQPQYRPLPVWIGARNQDDLEETISCWSFTWRERLAILFGRPLWLRVLTFGRPPSPILPEIKRPVWKVKP